MQNDGNDVNGTGARPKTLNQRNEFLKEMELRLFSDFPSDQLEKPIARKARADETFCPGGGDYEYDNTTESTTHVPTTSEDHSQERAKTADNPVLMKLLNLITDDNVAALLRIIPRLTKSLPYIGLFSTPIDSLLNQDKKHEAVLKWFEKLNQQLQTDKREMVNMIKMESVYVRYGQCVLSIQRAIRYLADIEKARDDTERREYIKRFKDLCDGEKHAQAMDNLIEGLRGTGLFQIDILDYYCTHTGGHLRKVELLAKELLQLVCGGLVVLSTYETLVHDESFANEILKGYNDVMEDVKKNTERVFERCKNEHKDNMLIDMNAILDSNVSNREAVDSLSSLMSEKYHWLENYCIVYNECIYMNYSFGGNYVSSLKRNGRFGVVFYQDATEKTVDPTTPKLDKGYYSRPIYPNTLSVDLLCNALSNTLLYNGTIKACGCTFIRPKSHFFIIPYFDFYLRFRYKSILKTLHEKGSSSAAIVWCTPASLLSATKMFVVDIHPQLNETSLMQI